MKRSWPSDSKDPPSSVFDITRPVVPGHLEVTRAPIITMDIRAYQKLFGYIELFNEEIAGMGFVDEMPGNRLHIADVFLVKQTDNTGVHVDISDGVHDLRVKWTLANEDESIARMKFWWHSHVKMETKWSSTDEGTARAFGGDYHISAVGNQFGDLRVRLDIHQPLAVTFDDLPLHVAVPGNLSVREQCEREIRELVKPSTFKKLFSNWGGDKLQAVDQLWQKSVELEARRAKGQSPFALPNSCPAPLGDGGLNEGEEVTSVELKGNGNSDEKPPTAVVQPVASLEAISDPDRTKETVIIAEPPPKIEERPESIKPLDDGSLQILCDRIRQFPKVQAVEIVNAETISRKPFQEIVVKTNDLHVQAKHDEEWDIGPWAIHIPVGATDPIRITCQSLRSKVRRASSGWIHPHVSSAGTICWDNDIRTTVYYSLKNQEYDLVVQLILILLESGREYDTRSFIDTYGSTLKQIGSLVTKPQT